MQEINVEAIMEEIRADIKKKGYTFEMLSFKEVSTPGEEEYNYEDLCRLVYQMNQCYSVAWARALSGNPIVVFVKRVIRVVMAFLIAPMSDDQNAFNENAACIINQLMGYIDMQNDKIKTIEKKAALLEEKVEKMAENR